METQRDNLEEQALKRFEAIARRCGYEVFKGQGSDNRIVLKGNNYFQFGDLRVRAGTHYVVIEAESAGGVTNLVKYWYCLERKHIAKPMILLHLFRQTTPGDYASHLALWDFLYNRMSDALADRIRATRYTYRDVTDLESAARDFEEHLKTLRSSVNGDGLPRVST